VEPTKEAVSSQRPHRALQNTPTRHQCQVVHKLSLKPSGFNQSHSLITLRTWLQAPTRSIYLALIRLEKQRYSIHWLIKSRDQYGMWKSLALSSLCKTTSNELILEGAQNNTLWPNTRETWIFICFPSGEERDGASMFTPIHICHFCKVKLARLSSKTQLQVIGQYGRVYWTSGPLITANQGAMSLHRAESAPAISSGLCVLQLAVPHMLLPWTSLLGSDCISTCLQSQLHSLWSHISKRHKVSLGGL